MNSRSATPVIVWFERQNEGPYTQGMTTPLLPNRSSTCSSWFLAFRSLNTRIRMTQMGSPSRRSRAYLRSFCLSHFLRHSSTPPSPPPTRTSLMAPEDKGRREKLAAALEQISRLNGQNLDHLTNVELQDLGTSLKQALGRVERMIDLRYRREMP